MVFLYDFRSFTAIHRNLPRKIHAAILSTLVVFLPLLLSAQEFDNYENYDSIVRDLTSSSYTSAPDIDKDSFETIKFHLGVGLITSAVKVDLPVPNNTDDPTLQGFEARFGIDLFSSHWVAETAVRSFNPESYSGGEVSLREFDLLLLYHTAAGRPFDFNIGGGMTARYLTVDSLDTKGNYSRDNTTPSSVFTMGVDFGLAKSISLGAQLSYRNPFIDETADKGSIDGGLQITGHL